MRAYEVQDTADDFSGIAAIERERPEPAADEVLIKIHACALNYRDLAIAHTEIEYPRTSLPTIPLSDAAGEVVEVGADVNRFEVGDRVATPFTPGWISGSLDPAARGTARGAGNDGTLAEYATYPAPAVPKLPDNLSYEEGATLPCAGLTAWHGLVENGSVTSGESVLLIGTGGVSTFGLQFAAMHGADPFVISSSDEKLERAVEMGATQTLNYVETPDWGEAVQERTDGGVDHVIEVGGQGTIQRSVTAARVGGSIQLIGVLSEPDEPFNPLSILGKGLTLQGVFAVGSTAMFERMNRAIEVNDMVPVIDRVYPFEEARDAYRYLLSGAHQGNVVISID